MNVPNVPPLALALLGAVLLAPQAHADEAILTCRGLVDAGARLACYDAIDVKAAASAPARTREDGFGLPPAPKPRREAAPASVSSTIDGSFDGWRPGVQIRLANGQVWRVLDGAEVAVSPRRNPKATVERGMLGAMYLRVDGSNQSVRVSRVQ